MDSSNNQEGTQQRPVANNEFGLSYTDVFKNSWKYLKMNLSTFLGIYFATLASIFIIGAAVLIAMLQITSSSFSDTGAGTILLSIPVIIIAVTFAVSRFYAALFVMLLKLIKENVKLDFSESWKQSSNHYIRVAIITLLMALYFIGGVILFIFPAFIFMTWYFLAIPAGIDKNLRAGDALSESARITKGHRMWLFGFVLTLSLIGGVAGLIPVMGQIVSLVLGLIQVVATVYIYVALSGLAPSNGRPTNPPITVTPQDNGASASPPIAPASTEPTTTSEPVADEPDATEPSPAEPIAPDNTTLPPSPPSAV